MCLSLLKSLASLHHLFSRLEEDLSCRLRYTETCFHASELKTGGRVNERCFPLLEVDSKFLNETSGCQTQEEFHNRQRNCGRRTFISLMALRSFTLTNSNARK